MNIHAAVVLIFIVKAITNKVIDLKDIGILLVCSNCYSFSVWKQYCVVYNCVNVLSYMDDTETNVKDCI